jgi:type 1 glutamine amidotransferase
MRVTIRRLFLIWPLLLGLPGCFKDGSERLRARLQQDGGAAGAGGQSTGVPLPELDAPGIGGAGGSEIPAGGAGGSGGDGGSGVGPGAAGGTSGGEGGTGPGDPEGTGGTVGMSGTGGTRGGSGGTPRPDSGATPAPPDAPPASGGPFRMLVLSKALEYRHDSIPVCQQMLIDLGRTPDAALPAGAEPGSQWQVNIAKEDLSEFTDEGLKPYRIIFWCNPTGTVFSSGGANGTAGKAAFQRFMTSGGGWAGVHSATDFENTAQWTWFQDQVNGGNFVNHDADGTPNSIVWQPGPTAMNHPVIRGIRSPWSCADEWYSLNRNPENVPGFVILGKLGSDQRPAVYVRELAGGGRSFYTIRGHGSSVYGEANFRKLIHQGVLWAVRRMK